MSSSQDEETIRQILLHNNYKNVEATLIDVLEAIKEYPGLKPALMDFVTNNRAGKRIPLLSLMGSIPITFKGSSYDLQVVIWLPTNYPVGEPQVFLTPTKPITVFTDCYKSYQSIGQDGKVDLSDPVKLDCQGKKVSRNLVELIDQLRIALIRSRLANFVPPGPPLSFPNIDESSMRMPYRLPRKKSDIKEMLDFNHYTNPATTAYDISDLICDFEKLEPFLNRFVYNNGFTEVLLCLAGAIAVKKVLPVFSPPYRSFRSAGAVYDVPVLIWIPKEYPNANPIVFVQFTKRLPLMPDPWYFDEHGHLDWKKALDKYGSFYPKGSPLLKLMDLLTNSRYGLLSLAVGKVEEESTGSSFTSANDFDIYENIEDSDDTATTIKTTEDCSSDPLQNDVTGTVDYEESSEQTHSCFSTDGDSNSKMHSCQICEATAEDGKEAPDEANQLITLCKQMMPMKQEEIPKELFRLCVSCKELTKEHWESEARMETIKAIIEKKAVDAVIGTSGPLSPHSQLENTGTGHQNKLRLKKEESLAAGPQSPDVERDRTNSSPVSDILPNDEPVVKVEVEEQQLICCAEEQKFFDPLFEEEHNAVKVEIKSEDVEAGGGNRPNPSLNAPVSIPQRRTRSSTGVRTPKGTLLVEVEGASIKICWTRCSSTNQALLECTFSNCDYFVPLGKTKDEMNEAYQTMKEHVHDNHKEEAERLAQRFGKQEHFKCPYHPICKLEFVDYVSVDRHEVVHRTCALCGNKFGKTTFYKNPSLALSHKCTPKAEKRNATVGKGDQGASGNKKSKNVLKSKNMIVEAVEAGLL